MKEKWKHHHNIINDNHGGVMHTLWTVNASRWVMLPFARATKSLPLPFLSFWSKNATFFKRSAEVRKLEFSFDLTH